MFDVADASTICPDFKPLPALVIPYYDTNRALMAYTRAGETLPFCRVRYLEPDAAPGLIKTKPQRYAQPLASGTRAYFPPVIDWTGLAADVAEPLVVTEGEGKALAGCLAGVPVLGLGGVFNFMASADRMLDEFDTIQWRARDVYICFDSDAALNPNILVAEARLVDELQRKRGAKCYLVRIPPDGDAKVGLDDFLIANGVEALVGLLKLAPSLGALDAKVVALNKSIAWIEKEGLIYDMEERGFIKKDNLINGSRFGSLTHIGVGATQRSGPKIVSVAATWLKHPHAQRFGEILFRPGEAATVQSDNRQPALNMWTGWQEEPGDITPFLQLTEYLFQNLPAADRDLPLKLMAYRAQNPAEKIPLALVLIGQQGCGKTLWAEVMRDAFAPYGCDVTSKAFHSEFQGWLERSMVVLINEAENKDMIEGADILKALISDVQRPMNEKYRPARQVRTYFTVIITSNRRAVGSFGVDDRRMIVVDCPPKLTTAEGQALYDTCGSRSGAWYHGGGPRKLMHYLLNLDLKGWKPPASAPLTAEKAMAYNESLTLTQAIAEQMRTAQEHTVCRWFDASMAWARQAELSSNPALVNMARATAQALPATQIRPWYTPPELTMMFPHITEVLLGSKMQRTTPSGQISRELREAGIPYLVNVDDPRGFKYQGAVQPFLVVANFSDWRQPITQSDFDRLMTNWPTYGMLVARRKAS